MENIDAVEAFTGGLDLARFTTDRKTFYAVIRALEIISEATRRLPDELKGRHPEIDWPAVAASGNVYRHEYEGVDEALVWHTIRHDLQALRNVAAVELDRLRLVPCPPPAPLHPTFRLFTHLAMAYNPSKC